MLCEVNELYGGRFLALWATLTVGALSMLLVMSGTLFWKYYVNASYQSWRYKSNPKYPPVEKIRDEIITMCKGLMAATLCPTAAIYMCNPGYSKAYCGVDKYGWPYLIGTFFFCWCLSDFLEFFYHRLGHIYDSLWNIHKFHHVFYNPSPFSVIADEYLDQLVRASPILIYPLIFPVNIDMLFLQFAAFFYAYGVYLHSGHELDYPDAHHPWINTAFQHYLHHAKSIKNKPYHTGFMIKLWDNLFGSIYQGDCFCSKCSRESGARSVEEWEKVEKQDYSPLLDLEFWWTGQTRETRKLTQGKTISFAPM